VPDRSSIAARRRARQRAASARTAIWATAPYLHNGSIPDAWSLLKPEDRPALWRRVSTPPRPDQAGQVIMGFDTDIHRAYDGEKLGWKYDELACGDGTIPALQCDPLGEGPGLTQPVIDLLYGNILAAWNLGNVVSLLQFTPQQIEDRKIYNTHLFSQGNEGHDFTAVLTDAERRALIEYLKTL
jgi:endo-cleaving rubber dioxygenase